MADYICKHCKFNNNGWCVALKKNKLSETIECETFKSGKYGEFETKQPNLNNKSKTKEIDIVAIKEAVRIGEIRFYVKDNVIYCHNKIYEVVKVGEIREDNHERM